VLSNIAAYGMALRRAGQKADIAAASEAVAEVYAA
jgi:hypothetical protein